MQDFDFVATPPDGPAGTAMMPILAHKLICMSIDDYWGPGRPLKGVRIHASSNAMEAVIGKGAKRAAEGDGDPYRLAQALAAMGDDIVHPRGFDLLPEADIEELKKHLIGRRTRPYYAGDMLTTDHVPDRINIELNRNTQRVASVWKG